MNIQSTSVNSEIQRMIEMGLIEKREKKSSKFFANLKNLFIFTMSNNQKQKQMKKSIAAVKANPEFVLVLGFITFLITSVTYNILVHGIASTAAFEF